MSVNMKSQLENVEMIAVEAGRILREGYGKPHTVGHKGVIDLVTEIDRQSEAFLVKEIQARFPNDHILAEENGEVAGNPERVWYIDPLDGTVNYAHRVPIFAVSIAYAVKGVLQIGVVYDPMRDECFSAERGRGAFLNQNPIHPSSAKMLGNALLVTGFPYDIWEGVDTNLDNFAMFSMRTQGVRRLGAAALDLCYVAAGRFDGYWEIKLKPWDVAAGALIVKEAGGIMTDIHGKDTFMDIPITVLAANPYIHNEMLTLLNQKDGH